MSKFEDLLFIVDDFIYNNEKIHGKIMENAEKELLLLKEEMKVFNLFRNNLHVLKEQNGISQN